MDNKSMDNKIYEYLDEHGLQSIAKGILNQVNKRISERIVTTLDETSDDTHVASAAAVYKAIIGSKHTRIKFVTGDIDVEVPLDERDPDILYFQRDNESDKTWMIYVWDVDNTRWVNVGDTEIDLSNYWSKDENQALREAIGLDVLEGKVAGIENEIASMKDDEDSIRDDISALQNDVATINNDINVINSNISTINNQITDINIELDEKVNKRDLGPISLATVRNILNSAYEETDPFKYEEVKTVAAVNKAIADAIAAGETEVAVKIVNDVDLTSGGSISIPSGVNAVVCIDQDVTVKIANTGVTVLNGGSLVLNGSGSIVTDTTKDISAIKVEDGAELTIDGITIDACPKDDVSWSYGVYAKNTSVVNFKSGYIKAGASCISTNNTTGGSTINISGGELYSVNNYAVYMPAQGEVNVTAGIVQGIIARMGTINISDDAQIIATNLDASNSVRIGENIVTSGSIELGDTITLISGSYNDAKGIDINVNISGRAFVDSEFRSAIGVYMLDTKAKANVNINVEDGKNVTTSDPEFSAITVYDHTYIYEDARSAGKVYSPVATSDVVVNVDGAQIYPVL